MRPLLSSYVVLALAGACTSYDEQRVSPDGADAGDASTIDGGSTNDASAIEDAAIGDGGVDSSSPSSLATNPGFELSTGVTCSPGWSPSGATSSPATPAHTGTRSCKVCSTGEGNAFGVLAELPFQTGEWIAQAFVRHENGLATKSFIEVAFAGDNGNYLSGKDSQADLIGTEWTAVQVSATSDAGPAKVRLIIGGEGPAGACVLVDDIVVEHF